jgi:Uma2 family endonuclease
VRRATAVRLLVAGNPVYASGMPAERAVPKVPLVAPSLEEWRAMGPEAREAFLVAVNDALSDPLVTMSEGRPHKKAKTRTLDTLGLYFSSIGRMVYLAEEMAVLYPGEVSFSPDVLAVLDVPQPEDDEREAWVVADEGKGLDLVIEVLHHGDRNKDLVKNVERYARLGIPEYFVYDRARQQIHGFRLGPPTSGAGLRRYQRIVPQSGRYASLVLGLDLALVSGTLRFFHGSAELGGTPELIQRLQSMLDDVTLKSDQAAAEAARARSVAQRGILAVLEARGVACPEPVREKLVACEDVATLERWLARATSAHDAAEVFAGDPASP